MTRGLTNRVGGRGAKRQQLQRTGSQALTTMYAQISAAKRETWPYSNGSQRALEIPQPGGGSRQYALRLRITSKNVFIRIWKSSRRLQLLMYQRSSLTRLSICSAEGVAPREPLHCAHPVRPGFT